MKEIWSGHEKSTDRRTDEKRDDIKKPFFRRAKNNLKNAASLIYSSSFIAGFNFTFNQSVLKPQRTR